MSVDNGGQHGPYETESDVIASTGQRSWPFGNHTKWNMGRLEQVIAGARVEIGSYDQCILSWLAGWEPQTVEVIASLIERAAACSDSSRGSETDQLSGYDEAFTQSTYLDRYLGESQGYS